MSIQIDWKDIETQVAALAAQILAGYEKEALTDFTNYRQHVTDEAQAWLVALAEGAIDAKELQSLIAGEKALLELHALKQTGIAKVALDEFEDGVIQIMFSAITSAVKGA